MKEKQIPCRDLYIVTALTLESEVCARAVHYSVLFCANIIVVATKQQHDENSYTQLYRSIASFRGVTNLSSHFGRSVIDCYLRPCVITVLKLSVAIEIEGNPLSIQFAKIFTHFNAKKNRFHQKRHRTEQQACT